jgi:hypothetical protein
MRILLASLVCLGACTSSSSHSPTIGNNGAPAPGPSQSSVTIANLPNAASSEWDTAVKAELLRAYDADRSGRLDSRAELRSVPCDVWQALHHAVMTSEEYSGDGVAVIYGFTTDKLWAGYALGIADKLRPMAADAVGGCGIELTGPSGYDPSFDYDSLGDSEREKARASSGY